MERMTYCRYGRIEQTDIERVGQEPAGQAGWQSFGPADMERRPSWDGHTLRYAFDG
jgi:hypothetical protein